MPKWFVYYFRLDDHQIGTFDIFLNTEFANKVKALRKKKPSKEEFAIDVKRALFYHFYGRYECEVLISSLRENRGDGDVLKVDIYSQVMLNWDAFINYIYEYKY